jgi:hypothetical protein
LEKVAALQWKRIQADRIQIQERFYEGEFDDTKTEAGDRKIPLNAASSAPTGAIPWLDAR